MEKKEEEEGFLSVFWQSIVHCTILVEPLKQWVKFSTTQKSDT